MFAHYLTNVGVLILEIEFLIDLIFVYFSCFWGEVVHCRGRKVRWYIFFTVCATIIDHERSNEIFFS